MALRRAPLGGLVPYGARGLSRRGAGRRLPPRRAVRRGAGHPLAFCWGCWLWRRSRAGRRLGTSRRGCARSSPQHPSARPPISAGASSPPSPSARSCGDPGRPPGRRAPLGGHADLVGPFRPAAYVSAYVLLALPTPSSPRRSCSPRRTRPADRGELPRGRVRLFRGGLQLAVRGRVTGGLGPREADGPYRGDQIGELSKAWTPGEKNVRLVGTQASILSNRFVWIGVALVVLGTRAVAFGRPTSWPAAGGRPATPRRGTLGGRARGGGTGTGRSC